VVDTNLILQIVLTGLFGSGGIAAIYKLWVRKRELEAEVELTKIEANRSLEEAEIKYREKELEAAQSSREGRKNSKNELALTYHPIFSTLDEIEFFFVNSFRVADEGRTMLIKELCIKKIQAWRIVIRKYVNMSQNCYEECGSEKYMSCNKSEYLMAQMLMEGTKVYTTLFLDGTELYDYTEKIKYDKKSLETMKVFLPIFSQWHHSREEIVRLATHEIPNSGVNTNCHEDWWDVLNMYVYALVQMKYDAVRAMAQLNGEITGRTFLGITIGDHH
jgi:hypothetical protein